MSTTKNKFAIILLLLVATAAAWGQTTQKEIAALKELAKKSPSAQYQLGVVYFYGEGVERDIDKGMMYLNKAADNDDGRAVLELGVIFYEQNDLKRAAEYLQKVSEEFPNAAYLLGRISEKNKDMAKAKEWYRKAAEGGSMEASEALEKIENKIDDAFFE